MDCAFTQATCHIDLSAIVRNFQRCGKPEQLMPVIKADAYGHGVGRVADALLSAGARRFAVGVVDEARFLRDRGIDIPLVCLMPPTSEDEWNLAREKKITAVVGDLSSLDVANAVAEKGNTPMPVAIKLETGMHRMGFTEDQLPDLLDALKKAPMLKPSMAISHFAVADVPEESEYTKEQYERFDSMTRALRNVYPDMLRSLQNSAGGIALADKSFDVIRPGITLYGGNPFTGTSEEALGKDFEWAMSLSTPVLQVTELKKGETVSYGRTFTAKRDMTLAVIGAGYATGVPRLLSSRLEVLLHGVRCRQVGRVCMSMMMIDVTDLPGIKAGDDAWLLGGSPAGDARAVTPQDWADMLGTISYEVLCLVGSLNPRSYD